MAAPLQYDYEAGSVSEWVRAVVITIYRPLQWLRETLVRTITWAIEQATSRWVES